MSSANQTLYAGLGPFQSLFHEPNYNVAGLMPQGFDQMLRGMMRCQVEAQSLMSRRAQAYFELPTRLSQCRTPQDLVQEQQRFWQSAFEQYSECSRHVMSAWGQMFQLPSSAVPQPGSARDYLSFPEPRTGNGMDAPSQPMRQGDRKVA